MWLEGLQEANRIAIQNCIVTGGMGTGLGAGWAGGGHAGRARSAQAGVRAGAAGSCARGREAQRARGSAEQAAAGRAPDVGPARRWSAQGKQVRRTMAAWALGAWPRRAGWLRAVHSVHSACFRSGLTRYCS